MILCIHENDLLQSCMKRLPALSIKGGRSMMLHHHKTSEEEGWGGWLGIQSSALLAWVVQPEPGQAFEKRIHICKNANKSYCKDAGERVSWSVQRRMLWVAEVCRWSNAFQISTKHCTTLLINQGDSMREGSSHVCLCVDRETSSTL